MRRTLALLSCCAVLAAGCSSTSGGSPSQSAPAGSSSVSAAPGSSARTAGSPPGAAAPTGSTSTASARQSSGTPATSGHGLDEASIGWVTTYCNSLLPIAPLGQLNNELIAARGDNSKIWALLVQAFQVAGGALNTTASKLNGVKAPSLIAAGTDVPALVAKVAALGATLTADGTKVDAINPVTNSQGLANALAMYGPDLEKVNTVLGAAAGLKMPAAALAQIHQIPACTKIVTTG